MGGPPDGLGNTPPYRNGIPLREYMERLLSDHGIAHVEHQQAHSREHDAAQKAIDLASILAKEGKEDSVKWRQAMEGRERDFARSDALQRLSDEADRRQTEQDRRIGLLERSNSQTQGALNIARFIGFSGLVSGAAAILWLVTRGA